MAACLGAVAATSAATAAETASGSLSITVLRWADTGGNSPFYLFARLELSDESPQQVLATIVGPEPWLVTSTSFTRRGAHEWYADIGAATLEQLQTLGSGSWTIEVLGGRTESMSEFTLDLSALTDADLPPTPAVTSPPAFSRNVPRSTACTWTNPWAPGLPDRLELASWSANGCGPAIEQSASSEGDGLALAATSWQPPIPLGPAANSFRVESTRWATAKQVAAGPIAVVLGSMRWVAPPGAPEDHPAAVPLTAIGSAREVTFEVAAPKQGDFNGDGVVDGDDLGTLLGNWG